MTVNDVYLFLDNIAPFRFQESYDNSGFLIGDGGAEVKKICVCLDITLDVIAEASEKGANLIISHHPVIFKPLSGIKTSTPVFELIKNSVNAICFHTNFDGVIMSDIVLDLLGFPKSDEFITEAYDNAGAGKIADLDPPVSAFALAEKCKRAFKSPFIRYVDGGKPIKRVGVCSGAGGSYFDGALDKGCDAYITAEVRHDLFIKAKDTGVTLVDAGHFHTEAPFCGYVEKKLREWFPQISIFVAESGKDVCDYI